jgi:ATP-dependent Lon protease
LERFRLLDTVSESPYLVARIEILKSAGALDDTTEAVLINIRQNAVKMVNLLPNIPQEAAIIIQNIEDPEVLVDMISMNLNISIEEKMQILSEINIRKRYEIVNGVLTREVEMLELSQKINEKVRSNIDKTQREYYLREQLKAIQRELGEVDEISEEVETMRQKLEKAGMPEDVKKTANEELSRLARLNPASPEYPMLRNYIDLMLELPWSLVTEDSLDINEAQRILDEDHYDIESAKKRILEYLSVRKLNPEIKGPILCFIGPPGVGKTSLGQSIARALGRKFIRMSLGGIHDEAEIRGHRRTYIGALPGRIIQGIRKAGSRNPLFMLDEIDKVGADYRGDPTSALLEVLDPAQNFSFQDNYLGVPFDLSKVMFICTGNEMTTVPGPLLDRLEVLTLPGYTEEEKLQIAKRYLVKRQIHENGLTGDQISFTDDAIRVVINSYTREAGVRNLEREIANVCRGVARKIASGETGQYTITGEAVSEYLGPIRFFSETVEREQIPGVAVGLAWTPVGGTILFVESGKMTGNGKLLLTGKLGEMMKESAQAALSYIRSKAADFDIPENFLQKYDLHIHIPAGAIPKDGPSAGVALFASLLSILKEKSLPYDVAMTGEITLRGLVLPVGGIKEKLIGAKNAGIREVLMPRKNEKDLLDVPNEIREQLKIHLIDNLDEAIALLLPGAEKTGGVPQEQQPEEVRVESEAAV